MDERDEDGYESETETFADPITERVRIIGAEAVGTAPVGQGTPSTRAGSSPGAAAYPDDSTDPVTSLEGRSVAPSGSETDEVDRWNTPDSGGLGPRRSVTGWLDEGGDAFDEPARSTELPHWTDPPTGQVPAVLERRSENDLDSGSWSASGDAGPAWREHRHEWDDSAFDPSLLADETTRVGAMEEVPLEERQPWEFDDLGTPAGGTPVSWGPSPDPGGVRLRDEEAGQAMVTSSARSTAEPTEAGYQVGEEPPGGQVPPAGNGVPSISSSPLRGSPDPLSPAAVPGARRRRRPPVSEPSGGGGGRNVPLSIATGLGFAAVAVACFELGSVATVALSTVVVVLAAAEAYAAFRRSGSHPATLLGLVATAAAMVAAYAKGVAALPLVLVLLIVTSMVWYLVGAERGSPVAGISATVLGFAWVGLLGSFAGLLLAPSQYPQRHGVAFLFGAVVATVGADVGALVIGGWRGRHPLAPRVSPHKTWEGLIGGTVFAVLASAAITGQVHPWTPAKAAVLGLVVAVVAPVGDLCESLLKRDLGLKDMGSLLPGHGGVLDRVDALLFVLPATYYLVRVLHLG
ncbi:MAG TPA: phosphatidate cytidylyltransferase [Acidimicrobiales bacterium]|nr:phosphatidate cytidylyltransferase [Acidimicrobiales bacterium]